MFLTTESNVDSERATQMTEWLKNNIWPASQVEHYMKETAIQRAKWIRDHGSKTIMEIVKEYPRLLDTPGMVGLKCKNKIICSLSSFLYNFLQLTTFVMFIFLLFLDNTGFLNFESRLCFQTHRKLGTCV